MSKRDLDDIKHEIYGTKGFKEKVEKIRANGRKEISAEAISRAGESEPIDYYAVDKRLDNLETALSRRLDGAGLSYSQREKCAEALIAVRVLKIRNDERLDRMYSLKTAMENVDLSSYNATREDLPVLRATKKSLARSRKKEKRTEKAALKDEAKQRGNTSVKVLSSTISDPMFTISDWATGTGDVSYVLGKLLGKTKTDRYGY